jgi:GxxExxY protein
MVQGGTYILRRRDILYPKLSFDINGVLFDVHNQIGGSHHERYYQKAVAIALGHKNIAFREQVHVPLTVNGQRVGRYYLDFLIEEKIILELKRGRYIPRNVYSQANQYLSSLNLKLAIVGCFGNDVVTIKRIINHKTIM